MFRNFLYAKIHRASVTERDMNYEGSISIDSSILQAAALLPGEKVDVYNITNGERFTTYILAAPAGSGKIGLNGAAVHKVSMGDLVIIAAYCQLAENEIAHFKPHIVLVKSLDNLQWQVKE